MELTVILPPNYPLGSPDIICERQISGTSQKNWLLQFKKCVLHEVNNYLNKCLKLMFTHIILRMVKYGMV